MLPIGGLKEKLLAAHRAGMKTVLIPKENVRDLDLLPEHVREELDIVAVESMDEVLARALVEPCGLRLPAAARSRALKPLPKPVTRKAPTSKPAPKAKAPATARRSGAAAAGARHDNEPGASKGRSGSAPRAARKKTD